MEANENAQAHPSTTEPHIPPHRALVEFYGSQERAGFVQELFDRTAQHYDRISAMFSFGTDRQYRRMALRRAGLVPGMQLLDVATGTGLVASAALSLGLSPSSIIGIDPSLGMLHQNKSKTPIRLVQGRGETLPFQNASFDFISMGYALRHVEDLLQLFSEFRRVLKPGGRLLILEISRPRSRFAFQGMSLYMNKVVPFLTRLRTRDAGAAQLMKYYWATIAECVPPEQILTALSESGLLNVQRKVMGQVLSEYTASA